ncbi:MAG: SRPBCC family protein [Chitinophagaceae bacterium]|nr:SRPBCC family protein [Chitinophagaceae bacterium]
MSHPSPARKDSASLLIKASAEKIYEAFLDPNAIAAWRPPSGMSCEIFEFDAREGGKYRMAFRYKQSQHAVAGKTSEHEDQFEGRFLRLVPHQQIVEEVVFKSDDPAFAGAMTVTTLLKQVPGGTEVSFIAENVPAGVRPEDHIAGMTSSLRNLAAWVEPEKDILV